MALGAILGAALALGLPSRTLGLYIDGLDVVREVGANGYGVDPASVELEEQGPDGVSSLTFVIEDPTIEVVMSEGQLVRFQDIAANLPMFLGFIQSWSYRPASLGRMIEVRCIGIEALLDWMIVPTVTVPMAEYIGPGVQRIVSAAISVGFPLRHATDPPLGPWTIDGSLAIPVGALGDTMPFYNAISDLVITGQTLREAIRILVDSVPYSAFTGVTDTHMITVDFYGNLRIWRDNNTPAMPSDYAALTVLDTAAGTYVATNLVHETDVSTVVHQVYIAGSNAAGSGLVTDGAIKPGPVRYISDTSSDTGSKRNAIGAGYLGKARSGVRGSFTLDDGAPSTNVRAGSKLTLTDVQAGVAASFRIMSITKTFIGVRQTWRVAYGGLPKSASSLIRRLTRNTLA